MDYQTLVENSVLVPFSGCLIPLVGSADKDGYLLVRSDKSSRERAHRFSYRVKVGPIPSGLYVCHTCDVRECINPAHLFLGNHQENMDDMVLKNRNPKGELHGRSKLNFKAVEEIRSGKISYKEAIAKYEISSSTFYDARSGKLWNY